MTLPKIYEKNLTGRERLLLDRYVQLSAFRHSHEGAKYDSVDITLNVKQEHPGIPRAGNLPLPNKLTIHTLPIGEFYNGLLAEMRRKLLQIPGVGETSVQELDDYLIETYATNLHKRDV